MISPLDTRYDHASDPAPRGRACDPFGTDEPPVDLLLYPRMRMLGLDPHDVAGFGTDEFETLRRRCRACGMTVKCAADLADEFADPGWQDWRDYCPNATTLSIVDALRRCRAAADS
jgi:hypothetical protein